MRHIEGGFRTAVLALGRLLGARRGSIAIEFALTFPVVLIVVFSVIEFGRYYWVQSAMQQATVEVARDMMTMYTREYLTQIDQGASASCGDVSEDELITCVANIVLAATEDDPDSVFLAWSGGTPDFTVTKTGSGNATRIQISGTIQFNFLIPLVTLDTATISAGTEVPLINFGVTPS